MNKEELQPLILEALRQQPDTQFVNVEHRVRSLSSDYMPHDALILREILWELLVQGILAPGFNSSNLEFPFIHVTDFGKKCLQSDIQPHAPNKYLKQLEAKIGQSLDIIVFTYIREGLDTFLSGQYLATTVMLGVASERCIDLLIETYANAIIIPNKKSNFEKKIKQAGRSVKRRFDILRQELLETSLPSELRDALDIQLSGIFTLIRYSRNDVGHPTGRIIDRDEAHGNLLLFPQYCKRVYELIDYFKANSV